MNSYLSSIKVKLYSIKWYSGANKSLQIKTIDYRMPKQWPVAALTDSWPDDHCWNTITIFLDGRIGAKRACVTILCGRKMTDTGDLTLSDQEHGWMERLDFKVPRLTDCYEIIENDIKKQSTVNEDCRVLTLASL